MTCVTGARFYPEKQKSRKSQGELGKESKIGGVRAGLRQLAAEGQSGVDVCMGISSRRDRTGAEAESHMQDLVADSDWGAKQFITHHCHRILC